MLSLQASANNLPEEVPGWTGRYSVRAVIAYRGRHNKAGTMQVITYQPEMAQEEILDVLLSAGY